MNFEEFLNESFNHLSHEVKKAAKALTNHQNYKASGESRSADFWGKEFHKHTKLNKSIAHDFVGGELPEKKI